MSIVLDKTDKALGNHLKDSQSSEWELGALITGSKGGAGIDFSDRHKEINSELARCYADLLKTDSKFYKKVLYQGRGAYTGMIDDQINNKFLVRPTRRVIDDNANRWHPGEGHCNSNRWGLISPDKAPEINLNFKERLLNAIAV